MRTPDEAYALPHHPPPDFALHRRQRRQYGRRFAPLRCQRQRPPPWCHRIRHQGWEVKNLNSFRYLAKALEYEIERHIGIIESGGPHLPGDAPVEPGLRIAPIPCAPRKRPTTYRYFPDPESPARPRQPCLARRKFSARSRTPRCQARPFRFRLRHHAIRRRKSLTGSQELADYFESGRESRAPPAKPLPTGCKTETPPPPQ